MRHLGGGGGHPSPLLPSAIVLLSGQQPNSVSAQWLGGHPLKFFPMAGDTPSSQQPYVVSLQVFVTGQPAAIVYEIVLYLQYVFLPLSNGPSAGVILSMQHPYLVFAQSFFFFLLHTFGLDVVNISVIEVVSQSEVLLSSVILVAVVDQISNSVDSVDSVLPTVVLSEAKLLSVL